MPRPTLGARTLAAITLAALGLTAASSCIRFTPFASDPSVTDLTAKHLARIAEQTPGPSFRFVALGDTHSAYDEMRKTVRAINALNDIAFVLIVGDMTDQGRLQEYEWSYEVYRGLRAPFLTVIGNHDALGKGDEIYREMYGAYDYAFRYGHAKFVMFNSNTLEFGKSVPKRDWIESELADTSDGEAVILVTHVDPTHPDDYVGGTTAEFYEQLVQRPRVSAFIHGHQRDFELFPWHGVPVLQCSTFEKTFFHTIVSVTESGVAFERCRYEICEPVTPVPSAGIEP